MEKSANRKVRVSLNKRFIRLRRYRPRFLKASSQKQNLRWRDRDCAPHNTNQFLLSSIEDDQKFEFQPDYGSMLGFFKLQCQPSTSTGSIKCRSSNVWKMNAVESYPKKKDLVQNLSIKEEREKTDAIHLETAVVECECEIHDESILA